MQMQWLVILIAAVMAIFNLSRARQQPGALFRGLAWISFAGYFFFFHPWFLYIAMALFVIGLFIPSRPVPREDGEATPPAPPVLEGEVTPAQVETASEMPSPYIPAPPALPCTVVAREVDVPCTLTEPAAYPTADGRTLTLAAGTHPMQVTLRMLYTDPGTDDFPSDSFAITHRVVDNQGQVWQAEVPVGADLLTQAFVTRLECLQNEEPVVMHREETAPPSWRETMTRRALLAEVHDVDDSRSYYQVTVDDQLLIIQAKYQAPTYCLAWLPDDTTFLVRVTNMIDRQHAAVDTASDDMLLLPPLYFTLAPDELLLQTAARYHDAAGILHDEDEEGEAAFSITFQPTGSVGLVDAGVAVSG